MDNTTNTAPSTAPSTGTASTGTASFRLRRSRTDRVLGGVIGGLAADLDVDANLLRLVLVALTVLGAGVGIPLYAAAWFLAPEAAI